MKKGIIGGVSILAVLLVLALGSVAIAAHEVDKTEDGVIAEGVYAGDINLSGLTEEEAETAVNDYIAELEKKSITMVTGKHKDTFEVGAIGVEWTNQEIIKEAVELGKNGNLIARFKALSDLKKNNQVYELNLEINDKAIKTYIKNNLKKYDQEAKEPELTRSNGSFVITAEEDGLVVNTKKTIAAINQLLAGNWTEDTASIETVVKVDKPKHTAKELETVKDLMGSRTTTYASSNRGRTQSLELSTQRLNGTVIWPGETISVSTLMGERSKEGGYGTGQGYFGTNVEETVGAGICQTASTLYNAALYAELDIVERYHHTLIVTYVDYAMDSTIYAGSDYKNPQKDLKLKNPYEDPIYISASAGGGYCTFQIYGNDTRPENREVKYVSKTISKSIPSGVTYTDDPSKPVGYESTTQAAYPAVKASLTKIVLIDGKETESTVLHTDSYSGANRKAIRGTKKVEPTTTQAPTETTGQSGESTAPSAAQPTEATNAVKPTEATQAPSTSAASAE